MVGFFEGIAAEGLGHLGITLTVGLTAHRQIHAHFGAFAAEVILQALPDLGVATFGHADHVLVDKGQTAFALDDFIEFLFRCLAERTSLGSFRSFVHVSAHGANPFFSHDSVLLNCF